jgi:hypothetical protein
MYQLPRSTFYSIWQSYLTGCILIRCGVGCLQGPHMMLRQLSMLCTHVRSVLVINTRSSRDISKHSYGSQLLSNKLKHPLLNPTLYFHNLMWYDVRDKSEEEVRRWLSSGLLRRVVWYTASIIREIAAMTEAASTSENVGKPLPDYTAQQPKRHPPSCSPPWEPQISRRRRGNPHNTILQSN